jgi:signal transduction protein with GAF and PtsI domain
MDSLSHTEDMQMDALHEIGRQIAASDHVHEVLDRVLDFTVELVKCDSCLIYVLSGDELILRASKNPHADLVDNLKLRVGEGITGWVAEHREPVALPKNASRDPRFRLCNELPEDNYEALLSVPLLSRGRLVGVMNLQHRQPHAYSRRQVRLISTIGFLVGAEVEMARLEAENANLSQQLETRKLVERAKGILQRELNLNEEQAYLALQRQSRQKRKPMKEIAEAIVLSEEIKDDSRIN